MWHSQCADLQQSYSVAIYNTSSAESNSIVYRDPFKLHNIIVPFTSFFQQVHACMYNVILQLHMHVYAGGMNCNNSAVPVAYAPYSPRRFELRAARFFSCRICKPAYRSVRCLKHPYTGAQEGLQKWYGQRSACKTAHALQSYICRASEGVAPRGRIIAVQLGPGTNCLKIHLNFFSFFPTFPPYFSCRST